MHRVLLAIEKVLSTEMEMRFAKGTSKEQPDKLLPMVIKYCNSAVTGLK